MVLFTLSAEKIKISANENIDIATKCEQGLSLSLKTSPQYRIQWVNCFYEPAKTSTLCCLGISEANGTKCVRTI